MIVLHGQNTEAPGLEVDASDRIRETCWDCAPIVIELRADLGVERALNHQLGADCDRLSEWVRDHGGDPGAILQRPAEPQAED